jgi:hypothetical protein
MQAAARRCKVARIPDFRSRPLLALDLAVDPADLVIGPAVEGEPSLLITYADERTRYVFNLGAPGEAARQPAPAGSRPVAANGSWRAFADC